MKIAIQAADADEARAFFGLLFHGDSPYDVTNLRVEDDPGEPFFAEMNVELDTYPAFFLRRAGLEWLAAKMTELRQVGSAGDGR